jgi:hypothetical protein
MWNNYLNFMTIERFNQLLVELPFEVRHRIWWFDFQARPMVRGLANEPVLTE